MPPKRKREHIPFNPHTVNGPGVWVAFVRGRDHQAGAELVDVFEELASELWPADKTHEDAGPEAEAGPSGGIDDALAAELAELKAAARPQGKGKAGRPFNVIHTDVECVLFVSCRAPVDPLALVLAYFASVEKTKATRLKYVQRLIPIQTVYPASLPLVESQARKMIAEHLPSPTSYRIEVHIRSHANLQREEVMKTIADAVPKDGARTVDFKDPRHTFFCTVFKSVSMMGVLPEMARWGKYNPHTIAGKDADKDL